MMPTLPPIPWQPMPITPLPDVFIDDTPTGWTLWDSAVRALDEFHQQSQPNQGKQ